MSDERDVPSSGPRFAWVILIWLLGVAAGVGAYWMSRTSTGREVMTSRPPNAQRLAVVREERCDQAVCQTLWIGHAPEDLANVATLAAGEKIDELTWSADGYLLGAVVNGYQLRVFDPETLKQRSQVNLLPPDAQPTSRIVRGVTFSPNGAAVTFDECPRAAAGCRSGFAAIR